MSAYYNDIEPFVLEWSKNLIAAGHVAPGVVDERSIVDVLVPDVVDHTQCHFFSGICVWSRALRLAGWPDEVPAWTGSCPCQPFSAAGQKKGLADDRHLWPEWFRLIRECRPPILFGEQVATPAGLEWLDVVLLDLESAGYTVSAFDLPAASVGAPHLRQRLYFTAIDPRQRQLLARRLANACEGGRAGEREAWLHAARESWYDTARRRAPRVVDDASGIGGGRLPGELPGTQEEAHQPGSGHGSVDHEPGSPGPVNGWWRDADWVYCRDGVYRPIEPGVEPLADGFTQRVGKLRAYGNAIVAQVAAVYIASTMDYLLEFV